MTTDEVHQNEDHLRKVLKSKRFLDLQGLGGDIPHFIYPFDPADAEEVNESRERLIKHLKGEGITVTDINLYDLASDLIKERGLWDRVLEMEAKQPKERFLKGLQSMLSAESHLAPAIKGRVSSEDPDIVFLSGVGEVFPYIRTHNILSVLERVVTDRPLVVFFPGQYLKDEHSGSSLTLFNRLTSDRYYRARNILDQEA